MQIETINFRDVPQFSEKDKLYTVDSNTLEDFISANFEYDSFKQLIEIRKSFNTDRQLLQNVIKQQYASVTSSEKTLRLIDALSSDNCFTVTTAHQPSLLTGPLYYTFKILSTIKLASRLQQDYPDLNIIPVFVSGSEDHDFEEINHLHLFGKTINWQSDQKGSVGNFSLDGIKDVIDEVRQILGANSKIQDLMQSIDALVDASKDYGDFSFKLTHLLFDHLGVIVLRMDAAELKKHFIPMIKEEIFNAPSQKLIEETQDRLEAVGVGKQAHAREINFFYKSEFGRNRIVLEGDTYKIVDTNLEFTTQELELEIHNHPEKFSPNVVMRPVYQEYILPNLAYIGGGGEIAYWLERKTQFQHFGVPFPMLIRRNSALLVKQRQIKQIEDLGLKLKDFFERSDDIIKTYIAQSDQPDYRLSEYKSKLSQVFNEMDEKIKAIDPTISKTNQAELAKAMKSVDYLESKLKKTIKQREEVQINRIHKLKESLFPSGLQERHDNILEYLSAQGIELIDQLYEHMNVFDKDLKIFIL